MEEQRHSKNYKKLNPFLRLIIEVGFIIFLFYSNLLMGEFTNSGRGWGKGFIWAIRDIFTETNFMIAVVLAIIGFLVTEFLRKRV
jgi:Trk-type K+ transport system membrane component